MILYNDAHYRAKLALCDVFPASEASVYSAFNSTGFEFCRSVMLSVILVMPEWATFNFLMTDSSKQASSTDISNYTMPLRNKTPRSAAASLSNPSFRKKERAMHFERVLSRLPHLSQQPIPKVSSVDNDDDSIASCSLHASTTPSS